MMNDRLSLRAVHAFHAVVTLGSVAAAAEHLNVTQPAISHLLKSLEAWSGLTLFQKVGRRLDLTEDGTLFFNDVASAVPVISNLERSADAIRHAKRGHVRVVAIPVVADFLLPSLLGRFMRDNPLIEISLEVAETHRALIMLETGAVDLALVSGASNKALAIHADIATRSKLVVPQAWHPEITSPADLTRLQSEPFVALSLGSPFRYTLDQYLMRSGLSLNVRAHVRTQSAILKLVATGVGIAIIDQIATATQAAGTRALDFEPALHWSLQLVSREGGTLSTSSNRLLTFLQHEIHAALGPDRRR